MPSNRDPLSVAFVGKHKGIDNDIYKFEESAYEHDIRRVEFKLSDITFPPDE